MSKASKTKNDLTFNTSMPGDFPINRSIDFASVSVQGNEDSSTLRSNCRTIFNKSALATIDQGNGNYDDTNAGRNMPRLIEALQREQLIRLEKKSETVLSQDPMQGSEEVQPPVNEYTRTVEKEKYASARQIGIQSIQEETAVPESVPDTFRLQVEPVSNRGSYKLPQFKAADSSVKTFASSSTAMPGLPEIS